MPPQSFFCTFESIRYFGKASLTDSDAAIAYAIGTYSYYCITTALLAYRSVSLLRNHYSYPYFGEQRK